MRKSLIAAAAGVALVAGVAAGPVEAKSIRVIGVPCSDGSAIGGEFMNQGADYSLGFQIAQAGQWHVRIIDSDTTSLLDFTGTAGATSLNVHTQKTLPKGFHVLDYRADNLTTGVSCELFVSTKG